MQSSTGALSDFVSGLRLADVPQGVQAEAKRVLADTFACAVSGTGTEIGPIAQALARCFGTAPQASVAGESAKASVMAALYANGRIANAMDFDETFPVGAHFGVGAAVAAEIGRASCRERV